MSDSTWLVLNEIGILAATKLPVGDAVMVHYLTACCKADATGSGNMIVCRNCRTQQDWRSGAAWLATDDAAWERCADQAVSISGATSESEILVRAAIRSAQLLALDVV